ncbi:TolB family protein [Bacteroidota bacterium]
MKTQRFANLISVFMAILINFSCTNTKQDENRDSQITIQGEYFGQKPPGKSAELFAPGIMSTGLNELNAVFFPNGKELVFSVALVPSRSWEWRLVMMKEENGQWTKPEVAEFNKNYSGVDPFITFDGNRIYFCSNRPKSGHGEPEDNFDIWYVDRTDSGWSVPANMGPPINSDSHEFYPSLTKNGTMYFQSRREGGFGKSDIYFSKLEDGKYTETEILPEPINSEGFDGDALIAPDESYIIVSSERKENNIGQADLWISFKHPDGSWSEIVNMGPGVNSEGGENCQILSPCGKYLFFTSRRVANKGESNAITYKQLQKAWTSPQNSPRIGDIYWVDATIIMYLKDSVLAKK